MQGSRSASQGNKRGQLREKMELGGRRENNMHAHLVSLQGLGDRKSERT